MHDIVNTNTRPSVFITDCQLSEQEQLWCDLRQVSSWCLRKADTDRVADTSLVGSAYGVSTPTLTRATAAFSVVASAYIQAVGVVATGDTAAVAVRARHLAVPP